jgi:hypothetical protein
MKKITSTSTEIGHILNLTYDIFTHIFHNNCEKSTFYILSMTCKYFHSIFNINTNEVLNFSYIFLKEDNPLWFKNIEWKLNSNEIILFGGENCLIMYTLEYEYNPELFIDIYKIAANKGYIKLLNIIDENYSLNMKKTRINLLHFYEDVFFDNALYNQQFCCCEYLFNKIGKKFRITDTTGLKDDMPIESWRYLIKNYAWTNSDTEITKSYAEETKNQLSLNLLTDSFIK